MTEIKTSLGMDDVDQLFDDTHDSRMARNRTLAPRGPRSFRIEKAGTGFRAIVTDWPHESIAVAGTGTFQFLLYWVEDLDQTSAQGIADGFGRRTLLSPAIPAPGPSSRNNRGAGMQVIQFYSDPKYQVGYFFMTGVDSEGNESAPVGPVKVISGNGGTVPADVEHFQVSESGEIRDGSLVSVVSYSFRVPTTGGVIENVQFMYLNYPTLNEFSEGQSVRVTVGRGATQTGQLVFPRGLRTGNGSISIAGTAVTGVGTEFLTLAAAAGGDQIEVFGVLGRIDSVSSNTSMTLVSAWSGPAISGVDDWMVIGAVTIYAVSEGRNGARRDDPANAPSVLVDLDGNLSPPIAPGSVFISNIGGIVRIEADQVSGTQIDSYILYRSTGSLVDSGMALSPPQPDIGTTQIDGKPADANPVAGSLVQFNDSDFTDTQKEDGQAFVWYVTVRSGNLESAAASAVGTCRLTSSQDVDPSLTGRVGLKNLLYDSFIGGTAGNTVIDTDTSQDGFNGTSAGNLPGKPYGGSGAAAGSGKFVGHTRWHSTTDGAAAIATFINGNEVKIVAPGLGKTTRMWQEIDAWDIGLGGAAGNKITRGGFYVISALFRYDAGLGQPPGTFNFWIDQWSNNTHSGDSLRRYRDPADQVLKYHAQGSGLNIESNPGSVLLATWQRFYAIYQLDTTITTKQIRMNYSLSNCTTGELRICRVMLNEGEDIGYWTGDMGDTTVSQPVGSGPPAGGGDGPGTRDPLPA